MSDYWKKRMDELNQGTEKQSSYWKDRMNTLQQGGLSALRPIDDDEDDEPETEEDQKWYQGWLQKGAFENGVDLGSVGEAILGTVTDVVENAGTAIVGMGEKILDAGTFLAPYFVKGMYYQNGGGYNIAVDSAFDAANAVMKQGSEEFVAKDLYDEEAIVKSLTTDQIQALTGINAEQASILGEKSDQLVQSATQAAAAAGLQLVGVPWFLTTGATTFGSEAENALKQGASMDEAALSALVSTGAEILTEKIGGISYGGKTLGDVITKPLANSISNKVMNVLVSAGVDALGEGFEEVLSGAISAVGQKLTYMSDQELSELFTNEDAIDALIGGIILGGGSNVLGAIKAEAKGQDAVTGLVENDNADFREVYQDKLAKAEAEKGSKLTPGEKSEIYDSIMEELKSGGISTDTIEENLDIAPVAKGEYGVIEDILNTGKVNNTVANSIINDEDLSNAFTDLTGVVLEGTTEQKRSIIRQTVRDYTLRMQENENLAREAAMDAEEDYIREQNEKTVRESGYRSYIRGIFLKGANVADAMEIIRTPELRAEWEAVTGKTLPTNEKSAIKMIRQTKRNPNRIGADDIFAPKPKAAVAPVAEPVQEDIAPIPEAPVAEEVEAVAEDVAPVKEAPVTRKDRKTEKAVNRINKMLEHDKASIAEEFAEKRSELDDKDSYISNKASELYNELRGLKKGVKASELLGEILDTGHDWGNIRSALVNIKHTPDRVVNENSATESIVREILNEDYENQMLSLDEEYANRVKELETEAATKRKNATVAGQRKVKQEQYKAEMESLVGDTSTWVDKKLGIFYQTNTLKRNLRDIVRDSNGKRDIAKADAIYDALQGSYNRNQAELNRESNRVKSPYADLKITKAEDAYIQMLGEYRYNPDTTLTKDVVEDYYKEHKNNIDTAKVDRVIEDARKTYDDLIARVNEVLREQGMKEIPYRKGYFPHFTEDQQSFLAKLFNWKVRGNEIPTDIAGLTEQFNPNRSWQSFNKQRTSDVTDYSFMKGMDSYVQGALDWIYHIDDIQRRRAFENYIRYSHSEKGVQEKIDAIRNNDEYDADEMQDQIDLVYAEANNPLNNFVTDLRTGTNILAGKKSSADRKMEMDTSRKVYSVMTNISNRVSANMVAGSVSSALTNFIPITQSWGEVSPISSLRAMGDTIRSTFRDDGTINKSDFLTNRLRQAENLYKTGWDKASDALGLLMEAVDSFTSQTVWRSKYLENISKGMSEMAAIKNADQFAENVMAGRSKGNMPTIFEAKNPVAKVFTAFQLEVANQYGYMLKDMPQDMRNDSIGKLLKGYATMFMGAYAYNALYSSLTGRNAAFDPIRIIEDLLRDLGVIGDDEEEEPVDALLNLTDNILEEVPFVGGLLGGGRIPISSALPYDGVYEAFKGTAQDIADGDWKNLTNEWLNPVYYLVMPMGGGQLRKSIQGLSMFSDEHPISGSYTGSGKLRFPVEDTIWNRVKAGVFGQYASKNARYYFDNDIAPLTEKQIDEFIDVGMPIRDYWDYREGLSELDTLAEKADYINSLDLPVKKKNILINNIAKRDVPIDMTGYENYSSFDEFDFATKNPEKYALSKAVGGYDAYRVYYKKLGNIESDKDANGKTISGSRKDKVFAYINGLNVDYYTKLILWKSEYKSDNTYNYEILEYLNSREDISYDDAIAIVKQLGFDVDANGVVSW